jgi:dTDP-4-dehydrorhamnose 3,5-epimerase
MQRFEFVPTDVPDLLLITPKPMPDNRGWFMRSFSAEEFTAAGIDAAALVQENHSRSVRGVIRGLHVRSELREAKLVRVPRGRVFDVVVDLRPWSPTFLQWRGWILDDVEHRQVRIPPGCAHGFQALSDTADVCYKVDAPYDPDRDITIAWNDPDIGIRWPLAEVVISDRDKAAPRLAELRDQLPIWFANGGDER